MTKDDFLKLGCDASIRAVEVPEWGNTIHVKSMSGHERSQFNTIKESLKAKNQEADCDTWAVILTACDSAGNRLFINQDFDLLNAKSAKVISSIAKVAFQLNGWLPDALDIEKKD